jgi:RHS repeat-associated protein
MAEQRGQQYYNSPYKFNGKELDEETGLYYYGARYYDPKVSIWLSVDPLAEKFPNWSPYSFCFNNPLRFTDPTGMAPEDWVGCTNSDGTTSWKWDDNIKSAEQAKAAGYDSYAAPGSILANGKINGQTGSDGKTSLYLGHNAKDYSLTYPNKTVTPFQVGTEWLSGNGPRNRDFVDGDLFTEMLKQHSHVENTRSEIVNNVANGGELSGQNAYQLGGIRGVGLYLKDYSTLATGGLTGNLAVTYLGSYALNWQATPNATNGTISVNFSVSNSSTMQSASRPPVLGYLPAWQNTAGSYINETFKSGWGSRTTQTFNWTETIPMKR